MARPNESLNECDMADLARSVHEIAFERDFLKKKGNAFQDFVGDVLSMRYPGEFTRVRPWGAAGDKKNDGYILSNGTLFQCYAPNEVREKATLQKVMEDFTGAVRHWTGMKRWVFVHNSLDGVSPGVLQLIESLRDGNPLLEIELWGFAELREQVFLLELADREKLLGVAPKMEDFIDLGYDDLQAVVDAIQLSDSEVEGGVRPVPPGKLAHNKLSAPIAELLQIGMAKSGLVQRFLESHSNPQFGDSVGEAIASRYRELKRTGASADEVFFRLQSFLGGSSRVQPRREAAEWAVLSFFFEQCDIFERPPEGP